MQQYLDLLKHIMEHGVEKSDRTGTGTKSVFGYQMRFNLQKGFPLVTTKKVHLRSIIYELLWFLRGETNIKYLNENGVTIWDEWADEHGELGPVYGKQWRNWEFRVGTDWHSESKSIDQITVLIETLKKNPDSRRMIVSAWNVAELSSMALTPCHCMFQFCTREMVPGEKRYLDCLLFQRSCDTFLGVPFNIASYALLTLMIAQVVDMVPGDFVWTGGDVHIYKNHFEQVRKQLSRSPYPLPTMTLNSAVKDIFSFKYEDFILGNYQSHPAIKAPVAV